MKHWLIRCVIRDKVTNAVLGYGEPISVSPHHGLHNIRTDPMNWELVSDNNEVPDDTRGNPHSRGFSFKPAQSVEQVTRSAPSRVGK
jgi:hypothetical protein